MDLTLIQKVSAYAIPIIFAITVHEASHGYAARYFGDMTAHYLKRITLNPLRHIDPVGTILIPALSVMLGGILFGWAKPVPVNFSNLKNPKKICSGLRLQDQRPIWSWQFSGQLF